MSNLLVSYLTLRKMIGFLGVSLPIVLFVGGIILADCEGIQPSISDYYHTKMRDVFVGILCIVGVFLFCYKGHEKKDDIAGDIACVFALGVAFFPTPFDISHSCEILMVNPNWVGNLHFISAALLFLVLAYFSFFLFTKTNPNSAMTQQKKRRNRIYKICGITMVSCIVLIAVYKWILEEKFPDLVGLNPIFWLETFALWAFGFSWLTKGEFLLADDEEKK